MTLIDIDSHHEPTYELLNSFGPGRRDYVLISPDHLERAKREAPYTRVRGEGGEVIQYGQYHYSFVAGKVKSYFNGNPEWLWDAVKEEFFWDGVSAEDRAALHAVADAFTADF